MHWKRLLVLAVVVAGLAWAVSQRAADEPDPGDVLGRRPLFPELVGERVRAIRIDNLERGHVVRLEREPGGWRLTEPVLYPARDEYARKLVEVATQEADDAPGLTPAQAGLDPPRIVVEYTEALQGGGTRSHVVEIGRLDVEGRTVHVRAGGRVLRAPRPLDTAAERQAAEFRDRRIVRFDPRRATELARTGTLIVSGPDPEQLGPADPALQLVERDLSFAALQDGPRWLEQAPARTRLSAGAVRLFLGYVAALEARRFEADLPHDVQAYGLDPPMWTVSVGLADGSRVAVELGCGPEALAVPPGQRRWFARRAGDPHVLEVDPDAALRLATDLAWLRDPRLVDVRGDGVAALEFARADGRRLRLARDGEDAWTIALDGAEPLPAEPGPALDLLGSLREAELAPLVPDAELPAPFFEVGSLSLELVDGSDDRVAFGPLATLAGTVGRFARRRGDGLVGVLGEDPLEVLERPLEDWLATRILDLDELTLRRIELQVPPAPQGPSASWVRDPSTGLWSREGEVEEDRAFAPLVDRILGLRAESWGAPAGNASPSRHELTLTLVDIDGERTVLTFVRFAGEESAYLLRGGGHARLEGDLVEVLRGAAGA